MSEPGISVRVLVTSGTGGGSGRAEHGLALWETVPHGDRSFRILLHTGQTGLTLSHNAGIRKLDWTPLGAVAPSHGHYDHTRGLLVRGRKNSRPCVEAR